MLSLLEKLLEMIKDLFRSGDEKIRDIGRTDKRAQPPVDDGPVQPWTLSNQVLEECINGGMAYSESLRQLPCTYTVYVSESDYNFFYRSSKNEVEREIVSALNDHVRQTGDRMKPPTVTICIDAELESGQSYVEASFDAVEIEKTPRPDVNPKATPKPTSDSDKTVPSEPRVKENKGDDPTPEPLPKTPVLKTIQPQLVAADGSIHNLSDGATVGILRDNSRPIPSISLMPSPDLHFCAQRHGEFHVTRDGECSYRNLSNNGSIVVRAGVNHELGPNSEPFVLHSGDSIILGTGNPAITFVLSER